MNDPAIYAKTNDADFMQVLARLAAQWKWDHARIGERFVDLEHRSKKIYPEVWE